MISPDEEKEERSHLAAEYVLGTLDLEERRRAETLMRADPAFAAEVERWRDRLDPLLDAVPALDPPPQAIGNILSAIERESPPQIGANPNREGSPDANVVRFSGRWPRFLPWAAALAASLLALILVREILTPKPPAYVAVLESADHRRGFDARVDPVRNIVRVRTFVAQPGLDRDYELWSIREGHPPKSLGVIGEEALIPVSRIIDSGNPKDLLGVVLAVTVEGKGGSPTGQPSSPPTFQGRIVANPPA